MLDNIQTTTLPNGIRIITLEEPRRESARVSIWTKVGSRFEAEETAGASHFIEHLLFKGTPKRSSRKLSEAIESQGGEMNAFTGNELTCYYATIPYEKAKTAFDVLSDMYYNASFDRAEMDRERTVIVEEINMYADRPDIVVQEKLEGLVWEGHPLGRPILGSKASVTGMPREVLLAYRERCYTPSATVFSFYGRVKHRTCVRWVEKATSHLAFAPLSLPEPYTRVIPQGLLSVARRTINQTHLALAWRNLGYADPNRLTTEVMSCLMGENMSSRLFQNLREKRGLCYSIASGVTSYTDSGFWSIQAGCDPKRAYAGAKAIFAEVKKLREQPVSHAELKRTVDYLAGSLRLRLERNPLSWTVRNALLLPQPISVEEAIAAYRAVTADDILRVAQAFSPESLSMSIVCPEDEPHTEADWMQIMSNSF